MFMDENCVNSSEMSSDKYVMIGLDSMQYLKLFNNDEECLKCSSIAILSTGFGAIILGLSLSKNKYLNPMNSAFFLSKPLQYKDKRRIVLFRRDLN